MHGNADARPRKPIHHGDVRFPGPKESIQRHECQRNAVAPGHDDVVVVGESTNGHRQPYPWWKSTGDRKTLEAVQSRCVLASREKIVQKARARRSRTCRRTRATGLASLD